MVKIKICGLKRLEDIEIVNKYKPDYIGFVFADSKRKVSHDLAFEMKNNLSSDIVSVGVFVDADIGEIVDLFDRGVIEIAQLHGLESEDYIRKLKENTNYEIIIDPSHAAGNKYMIEPMSLAAIIAGCDGLIIEVHNKPSEALCDKNQAIDIKTLKSIIDKVNRLSDTNLIYKYKNNKETR